MYKRLLSLVGLLTLSVCLGCGTSTPTAPTNSGGPAAGSPEYEKMMQMQKAAQAGAAGATADPTKSGEGQSKPADSKPAEEKPAEEKPAEEKPAEEKKE